MTDERRVGADDFNDIAHDPGPEQPYDEQFSGFTTTTTTAGAAMNGRAQLDPVKIVTLQQFVTTTDDVSDPAIGDVDDMLLPSDGTLLMYGDGGAGKTTLSVDALAHLAAGRDWLGQKIPKPLNVMLIENEGPRGPFRRRLAQKVTGWEHEPFADRVHVLEEPWTRFSLLEGEYRHQLGREITRWETDLVMVGPLASLGAKGTGTPDEVNEFDNLVKDLRENADRTFALWIVHHENKAGDVSGAWERLPDSLIHVSAQGNGKTRVHWRKVRWSSVLHNTSQTLSWSANTGFAIDEKKDRDYPGEILEAFTADNRWRTAREAAGLISANQDLVRDTMVDLVKTGQMLYEIGPSGRSVNAKCWRLRTDSDAPSHPESLDLFQGAPGGTDSVTPPIRGVNRVSHTGEAEPTDSTPPSHIHLAPEPEDDGIPF